MNTLKNKVQLIGNLGFDPEVREIASGRKVARLSIATHETYKNAKGESVTDTQWHTVVAWGQTAEQCERLLRKGMPVMLEGRLVHRSYEGKDGNKRYVTEVVMNGFNLLPKQKVQEGTVEETAAAA
jgi:single-strand DNA-binding protein